MGKLLIVNGSPRAPKSNSAQYAQIFRACWADEIDVYCVTEKRHSAICATLENCDDLLFVFPLYADGLPVTLMHFLKEVEAHLPKRRPRVHVLINCGFLEPVQNEVAVACIRLFCEQNGFPFGSVLCIGAGEAILNTPFRFLVERKIKKLSQQIKTGKHKYQSVTMPLPKRIFIRASASYWISYGQKYAVSRKQMETMKIEGK